MRKSVPSEGNRIFHPGNQLQTNNVETDDRGYIYIVDRANTGMHILELTGDARAIALH